VAGANLYVERRDDADGHRHGFPFRVLARL
jgi:hypothetical protein